MNLTRAKYVMFNGSINIAGMNAANIDAARDGCELHLHQETGGVFVKRGEDTVFISPLVIQSVELAAEEAADVSTHLPSFTDVYKGYPSPHDVAKGARNLADEVLAELGDDNRTTSEDAPKPRRRYAKLKTP